ncbi:MAG: hypothetical protein ACK42G_06885 [Candidatus Kapaibacteriota bacterium]
MSFIIVYRGSQKTEITDQILARRGRAGGTGATVEVAQCRN